jgi:hypothetical protein
MITMCRQRGPGGTGIRWRRAGGREGLPRSPPRERITRTVVNSSGGPVNTRTIAILALIIAVIVILILVL